MRHKAETYCDEADWWWSTCSCGWAYGPFPGQSDAADAVDDHLEEIDQ